MKTITTALLFCFAFFLSQAQTTVYHENMEVIDSITSNTLASNGSPAFNANTAFHHNGSQSYLGTFGIGDVATATSDVIDLTGNTFVQLKFWHICKIEFFDQALVQVSSDGGTTWTNLVCAQYQGPSPGFCSQGHKFTEAAYTNWAPGSPTIPDSTWWHEEIFDVSLLLSNAPNAKIRFKLADLNNNGMSGRYGWLIDDIRVIAAPCEIIPPVINLVAPVLQGTVYDNGPYTYSLFAKDNSGIGAVSVSISLNGAVPVSYAMTNPAGDSLYTVTPIDTFAYGDSICYFYTASDSTTCANTSISPTFCFVISQGGQLPYCDNFDTGDIWIDSLISGSPWQLGTPTYGSTNTTHSAPNSWDVNLNAAYLANTNSFIMSPGFDFSNIGNATLKVWTNYYTQGSYDGSRIEYTINGGITWTVLGSYNDVNGVYWYNTTNLNSTGKPAWSGTSSGWHESTKKLIEPAFNLNILPVQFRVIFTSNATTQLSGFSIDDFCLTIPAAHDIAVTGISFPSTLYPTGSAATAKVIIKNIGSQSATGFSVNCNYNGVTGIPVIYAGSLAPGAVDSVNLPAITIVQGIRTFCGYVALTTDVNHLNDTVCLNLTGVQYTNITYCNNFEITTADWTAVNVTGNALWEAGTPNYGSTNSAHSGATAWDINLNAGYSGTSIAYLYSPYYDFTTACNARLEFWQNRKTTSSYDGARVEISQSGSVWSTLGVYNDPLGTNWYTKSSIFSSGKPAWDGTSAGWIKCTYNLDAYSNIPIIQIRYVFTSSWAGVSDGISIDDFCIIQPPTVDIGVSSIAEPTNNLSNGLKSPVRVSVKNYGCTLAGSFNVYYAVDGGAPIGPFAYNGVPLPTNGTVLVQLDSLIIPLGIYNLCAWTSFATDTNPGNDTLCTTLNGLGVDTIRYFNYFDGASPADFTPSNSTPGTVWELGYPNYGYTTGTYSGNSAWDINLNTAYGYNANCELLTPFFDFTNASNVVLVFRQFRNTLIHHAGMHIKYSLNNGPWTVLGSVNDPDGRHWYNHNNYSTGKPQWDGKTLEWQKCKYFLHNFDSSGIMRFKFVFTSDNFVLEDGVSIDDFGILRAKDFNLGLTYLSNNNADGGYIPGSTYTPSVTIKNYSGNIVDSIPVVLTINGNYITTDYYNLPLLPYQSATLIFAGVSYVIPQGTSTICAYTDFPFDVINGNDTMITYLVGVDTVIPSYTTTFDSADNWTAYSPDTLTRWEFGKPNYGLTDNAHSPPSCWDVNLNIHYRNDANCVLYSPWFDFTNVIDARISFWINYNTQTYYDGVRLDYTANGGNTYSSLGSVGGAGTSNWYNSYINSSLSQGWSGNSGGWKFAKDSNLTSLNNLPAPVRFKFIFRSVSFNNTNNDGFSLDDFSLYYPLTVNATGNTLSGNIITTPFPKYYTMQYGSLGSVPLNNVVLSLKVDGTWIVSDTINPIPGGPLMYNQTTSHTFSIPASLSTGTHKICAYTSLPNGVNDAIHLDDTVCNNIIAVDSASALPYCNDFESGSTWPTLNNTTHLPSSNWALGTPAKVVISGAHSGTKAWVTKLTGNYPYNDNSSVYSTAFNVDSGNCYELSFWHIFKTEVNVDGGTVEYSLNGGGTWIMLGDTNDAVNWFNTAVISSFGLPHIMGWTGTSAGWIHSSHIWTCNQTGEIFFRFRFRSNGVTSYDGWAIDDLCFEQIAAPCYLAVNEISPTGLYLYQNIPNPSSAETDIPFYIPHTGKVSLEIINVLGQIVNIAVNGTLNEGKHIATIHSNLLPSGVYNYTLKFDEKQLVRRMVVTK